MVYDISLTLILAITIIGIITIFIVFRKKRKKDLETLINEIENDLIDIKRNLENIKLILKVNDQKEKTKLRKHARKRSV